MTEGPRRAARPSATERRTDASSAPEVPNGPVGRKGWGATNVGAAPRTMAAPGLPGAAPHEGSVVHRLRRYGLRTGGLVVDSVRTTDRDGPKRVPAVAFTDVWATGWTATSAASRPRPTRCGGCGKQAPGSRPRRRQPDGRGPGGVPRDVPRPRSRGKSRRMAQLPGGGRPFCGGCMRVEVMGAAARGAPSGARGIARAATTNPPPAYDLPQHGATRRRSLLSSQRELRVGKISLPAPRRSMLQVGQGS